MNQPVGSNEWVLVAWTPVWVDGDDVVQIYPEYVERFNAQQVMPVANGGRVQPAVKRRKGKVYQVCFIDINVNLVLSL